VGKGFGVSHTKLFTVTEFPKPHGDVGRIKIIDWIKLTYAFDLWIPHFSLIYIHNEIRK